jgi:uncharacterized membrane protein
MSSLPTSTAGTSAAFTRPAASVVPASDATSGDARPPKAVRTGLWIAVIFLTIVGIFGAVLRLSIVGVTLATPPSQRPLLTQPDRVSMRVIAWGLRVTPGTPEYARAEAEVVRTANNYTAHPWYVAMHLVPGLLIFLLAPLQFSQRIRTRHIRFHRWSGRTILIASIAIVISAFYFGVVRSAIHPSERAIIAIIIAGFVFAASRAYLAIRRRDVARHREWMIRTYAFLIGIGTVRVVALAMPVFARGHDLGIAVITTWWIGWLMTLGAAELWIRDSRRLGYAAAIVRRSVNVFADH